MNEHITGRMDLMWNTENSRKVALAEGRYVETEHRHTGKQKLSSGMAMILGALLTIEIMIGGAMILNFDFNGSGYHCCCARIHGIILCSGCLTDR